MDPNVLLYADDINLMSQCGCFFNDVASLRCLREYILVETFLT